MKLLRKDNKNYAVVELEESKADRLILGMLENNRLTCLLPLSFRFVDDIIFAEYDITGLQPLSRIYESKKMKLENISFIIRRLSAAGQEMEQYLMRGENICLDPDFIFADVDGENLRFCCSLDSVLEGANPYRILLSFIMDKVDYGNKEAVGLAYSLVRAAEGDDPLASMVNLIEMENETEREESFRADEKEITNTAPMPEFIPQKKKSGFWHWNKRQKKKKKVIFAEEPQVPLLEEKREEKRFVTQPLERQLAEKNYYLQALNGELNKKLKLDHFPYTVGKLENADYNPDSPMVSRLHAKFDMGDVGIVIEDLNSSNGTYVNGESIFGRGRVAIKDGDFISFANMNFRLEVYGGYFPDSK